jgi:NCS1 family nucleobase:cation symporter-1
VTNSVNSPADEGAWPLLRSERVWGSWRLAIALVTASAATWCYLIGEVVGHYLKFGQGGLALTAGTMIGMLLVILSAGPTCIRFGIDSIASIKPQFGSRGWVIPASLQYISIVAWNAVLLIFFAKSLTQLLTAVGWLPAGVSGPQIIPFTTLFACVVVYVVLLWGARGVSRISSVLVLHVFAGLWMLYVLVTRRWPELVAAQPVLAHTDRLWNYTTGIEIGICSALSWWAYIGAMIRMAPSGRVVTLPVMVGMGAAVFLLSMIGVAGVLVLKVSDPSSWLLTVGGPLYGVIALSFVAAGNFGTAIVGIYATAVGLRNFRALRAMPWWVMLLIAITPIALVGTLIPEWVFDHFGTLLAFSGVGFAPIAGIQIADYFVLRRRRVDIRAIYDPEPTGKYSYWAGVNPAAVIAMAAGCATYVYLLNPMTYESHGPFRFLTASLPAVFVAACLFIAITVLYVVPAKRGGYGPKPPVE